VPKVQLLRHEAVNAILRYLGPLNIGANTPPLGDDPAIVLRNSMLYRAEAVGFHVDLLRWHLTSFLRRANADVLTNQKDPSFLHNCRNVLTFLSDDILFNAISMLDYVGNLAGYTLAGPNWQSKKWNGIVRGARDQRNPIASTTVGKLMVVLHAEWVDKLHDVRSRIIHERIILGDGGQELTLNKDNTFVSTLTFQLPPIVVKRLGFLQDFRDSDGRIDIVVGAEQIALRAIDVASSVMAALRRDLDGPPRRLPQVAAIKTSP
jgi:hypothetical protein